MNIFLRSLAAAFAALSFSCPSVPATAAAWGPETRLTNAAGHSWAPQVAAYNGSLHAVWFDYLGALGDAEILYARSTDNGTTWSYPVNLSASSARLDVHPVIAADSSGVYVMWSSDVVSGELFFRRSHDNGGSWRPVQQLTSTAGYSRSGALAIDASGALHAVYYDDRVGYSNIYHIQSCDHGATWTAEQNVTANDGVVDNQVPRLAVGQDGKLYLAFRSSREGAPQGGWPPYQIYLLRGTTAACPANPSWLYPAQRVTRGLPDEYSDAYGPEVAAGSGGAIHVAFWDQLSGNDVGYRRLDPAGAGFGPVRRLGNFGINHPEAGSTNSEAGNLGITVDNVGIVHLLFGENLGTTNSVTYGRLFYRSSADGGTTWSAVEQVGTTALAAMPRFLYAGGRVHAVWTDFRDNNVGGEIYYRFLDLQPAPASVSKSCAGARRDFNGDNNSDLTWSNAATSDKIMQLMSGGSVIGNATLLTDPNWQITNYGDFNADGKADIVWYNSATGSTAIWLMNGTAFLGGASLLTDPNWRVTIVGDFNGDGKSDLVWYNAATGGTAVWLMDGANLAGGSGLLTDPNWQITNCGDFNADGKTDIVWYNSATGSTAIWLMSGTALLGGTGLLTDPNWRVTDVGDFNGDGKSDLVWRNTTTGETVIWLLNGTTLIGGGRIMGDGNWSVTHIADLNGDGKKDLIWRNAATGESAAWLMNGMSMIGGGSLIGAPWVVTRTGDFNADGKADILLTNPTTGSKSMWLMNGLSPTAGYTLSTNPSWALNP